MDAETMKAPSWWDRVKNKHIDPMVDAVSENIPTVLAIGSSLVAVGLVIKTNKDLETANRRQQVVLDNIESKVEAAIEAPTIVKVEFGDELEYIGRGSRVD